MASKFGDFYRKVNNLPPRKKKKEFDFGEIVIFNREYVYKILIDIVYAWEEGEVHPPFYVYIDSNTIGNAFTWDDTIQGYDFWKRAYDNEEVKIDEDLYRWAKHHLEKLESCVEPAEVCGPEWFDVEPDMEVGAARGMLWVNSN